MVNCNVTSLSRILDPMLSMFEPLLGVSNMATVSDVGNKTTAENGPNPH